MTSGKIVWLKRYLKYLEEVKMTKLRCAHPGYTGEIGDHFDYAGHRDVCIGFELLIADCKDDSLESDRRQGERRVPGSKGYWGRGPGRNGRERRKNT